MIIQSCWRILLMLTQYGGQGRISLSCQLLQMLHSIQTVASTAPGCSCCGFSAKHFCRNMLIFIRCTPSCCISTCSSGTQRREVLPSTCGLTPCGGSSRAGRFCWNSATCTPLLLLLLLPPLELAGCPVNCTIASSTGHSRSMRLLVIRSYGNAG